MERPAPSEFGTGPRLASGGLYEATIEPAEPLRVGRMQRAKLNVRLAAQAPRPHDPGGERRHRGRRRDAAARAWAADHPARDPQPGRGGVPGGGLKFNMGGWWEPKFRISSAAGTDSVTFNLDL